MGEDETHLDTAVDFRQRAEEIARCKAISNLDVLSLDEARRMIYALQVRQIELELQNEELRESQAELRIIEKQHLLLTEYTSDIIWMMDVNMNFTYVSPSVERVRGYSAAETLAQPLSEIFTPASLKILNQAWAEGMTQYQNGTRGPKNILQLELEYQCKDGSSVWGENRISSVLDKTGMPISFVGISRDITKRKQAELALLESDARLHTLLAHTPVLLFAINSAGEVTFAEGQVLKTLRLTPEQIIGRQAHEIFSEPASIRDRLQHALSGETLNTTGQIAGVWLDSRITPLFGPDNQMTGITGVAIDISGRKQAEAEREQLLDELAQRNLQLQTVVEISKSAATFLDPDQLMKHMVNLICERFSFYYAGIFLVDEQNEYAILHAATGESGRRMFERGHRLQIGGDSMIGWCIANARARVAQDVAQETIRYNNPLLPETRSEVAIPLLSQDRCIGALSVQSIKKLAFSDDLVAILQSTADHLAIAIENARLYTHAQTELAERMRTQQALAWEAAVSASTVELAKSIIALKSLDDISGLVLEHAKRLTGSTFGFVGHIDLETGYLLSSTLTSDIWNQCQITDKSCVFKQFNGLWGWVLKNHQPLLTNHPQSDPRSTGVPQGHIPIHQFLGVPAMIGDELAGQIALCNPEYDYTGQDLAVIERLARLYALAVQQHRANDAQQKLTAQLSLQSAALQAAANAIAITNREGQITWVNPAFTRLTGYTFQEAIAQNLQILEANTQDTSLYPNFWHMILNGKAWHAEITNRRKDSTVYQEDITVTPVLDHEGEIIHFVVIKQDITGRKQAEMALQHYANQQAALYAVASAAATFLDPISLLSTTLEMVMKNISIDVDAGWVIIPDDTPNQTLQVVVSRGIPIASLSPEVVTALNGASNYRRLLNMDQPITEADMVFGDHPLPKELTVTTGLQDYLDIPLAAGQRVLGFMSVAWSASRSYSVIDPDLLLTLGRQIGLALRNAQLYQAARQLDRLKVLDAIGTAANSTLELDVLLYEVVRITCQALKASDGVVLLRDLHTGELVFTLTLTDDSKTLYGQRLAKGQGIAGWVAEYKQMIRVNNVAEDPRWYPGIDATLGSRTQSILCAPLIYRDNNTGVIEIINKTQGGFTEEDESLLEAISVIVSTALENARLYAAALERANELQLLYDERAATQAHLIQTEKVAALGRLAASIAHEINNPLQAIQGCLALFKDELSGPRRPEKLSRYLRIIDSEIERVALIVRRMRDFYRPAREEPRPTSIPAMLENVLELSTKQLQHSNIIIERAWTDDIPLIQANSNALMQVFLNLILNAIDAMPDGGTLRILVSLDQLQPHGEPPQTAIRIEFSDTGKGMSPQTLAHLFEPFFTTKEQGTGLGLYISHGIITSHNGKFIVSSEPGIGSTFVILLPLNYTSQ
jgi:two-component system NtrC family sensor kinase